MITRFIPLLYIAVIIWLGLCVTQSTKRVPPSSVRPVQQQFALFFLLPPLSQGHRSTGSQCVVIDEPLRTDEDQSYFRLVIAVLTISSSFCL